MVLTYFSINITRKVKIITVKHSKHYLRIKNNRGALLAQNKYGTNYFTYFCRQFIDKDFDKKIIILLKQFS